MSGEFVRYAGMKGPNAIFKVLVAPDAMQRLYQLRQEGRPSGGHRTRGAASVCLGLLAISIALLISTAWVPDDVRSYVKSRAGIVQVEDRSLNWFASPMTGGECSSASDCVARMRSALASTDMTRLDALGNPGPGNARILVRLELPKAAFDSFLDHKVVMLSLPSFSYFRADFFVAGSFTGTLYQGQRLAAGIPTTLLTTQGDALIVDALLEIMPSDRTIAGNRNQEGVMIATQGEYERYRDFLGTKRSNAAGAMGHLSKIVLALFCLLLFLIVDSSAESLGLALFMGLEAAAMGIDMGWLPLGVLGVGHETVFVHFFYQMGDILKLFFLLQMARVGSTKALPWLVAGATLSIPYAFFREYAADTNIAWAYKLSLWRDTIVGSVGALVCISALFAIRKKTLPWRKAALGIAATAAGFEVLNSWIAHSEMIRVFPTVKTLFTVFQANCGYLFALSTFLNISTLENRVRSLTTAAARADKIEREMELGQIVQKALMKPPTLPDSVDLICHHEAALYVSGDTYYAHWDKERNVVAFLVSDVTGHGVQAALKASACNVLAKTLWETEQGSHLRLAAEGGRLVELDRLTQSLLIETDQVPDFNSMCGCEFNLETGMLSLYRSNFTFPIVVEPREAFDQLSGPLLGEFWTPEVVVTHNQKVVTRKLRRGSFVVLLSDGFMESSRDYKQFTAYLRRQLSIRETNINVDELSEMVLRYEMFRRKIVDDRTLMIFQWTLDEATANASLDKKLQAVSGGLRGIQGGKSMKEPA